MLPLLREHKTLNPKPSPVPASVQDVILPRVLDDGTFATLSSLMLFNNVEVLMALTSVRPLAPHPRRLSARAPSCCARTAQPCRAILCFTLYARAETGCSEPSRLAACK